jgi:Raf kinase inhibitor-like YbhB/YbcL family protein
MRQTAWIASACLAATTLAGAEPQATQEPGGAAAGAGKFSLTSPDIVQGKKIPERQVFNSSGCTGQNVSPAVSWSNAPAGTKSFALVMHDPDAPTGGGWWHWIVYNLPADVTSLPADAGDPKKNLMPTGVVQGHSDYGTPGYGGPCPPPGKPHHYYLRLYALKVPKLEVPTGATGALIGSSVSANALAKAEIMGLYWR